MEKAAMDKAKDDAAMDATEIERVEIRPHMRSGLILIGIGGLNALTGASSLLLRAVHADTPAGIWADKLVFMAMIAWGIWISRKKIVFEDGSVRFFGLVRGNARTEIKLADIERAARSTSKRGVEIRARGAVVEVRLRPGSKAAADLFRVLEARGAPVP